MTAVRIRPGLAVISVRSARRDVGIAPYGNGARIDCGVLPLPVLKMKRLTAVAVSLLV